MKRVGMGGRGQQRVLEGVVWSGQQLRGEAGLTMRAEMLNNLSAYSTDTAHEGSSRHGIAACRKTTQRPASTLPAQPTAQGGCRQLVMHFCWMGLVLPPLFTPCEQPTLEHPLTFHKLEMLLTPVS